MTTDQPASGTEPRAVVITGIGLTTALAYGAPDSAKAWADGQDAVQAGDAHTSPAASIAEPHLRLEVPRTLASQAKFLSPSSAFAAHAAVEALAQAGHEGVQRAGQPDQPDNTGLTGRQKGFWLAQVDSHDWACKDFMPGMHALDDRQGADAKTTNTSLVRRSLPFLLLPGLKNNAYSFIATWFDLQGTGTALSGLAATGAQALHLAHRAVRMGRVEMGLVVATAMLTSPVARMEWGRHAATDAPPPGDGAVALVLESTARAEARGATILGRLDAVREGTGPLPEDADRWLGEGPWRDLGPLATPGLAAERAEDPRVRLGDMGPASDLLGLNLALAGNMTGGKLVTTVQGRTGTWAQIACTAS